MLRLVWSLALAFVALLATGAPVAAAPNSPTPVGTNLLVNPDGELGDASPDGYSPVTIPGWQPAGTPTIIPYGTPGQFPNPAPDPGPVFPDFGEQFFGLGLADDRAVCGALRQSVPLTGHAKAIDSRHMELSCSAQIATRGHQVDRARISLLIYDRSGHLLRQLLLASATATNEKYRTVSGTVSLPSGARSATLKLWQSRHDLQGRSCDSFYDNLSLELVHAR